MFMDPNIRELLKTSFMVHISMIVLPGILKEMKKNKIIGRISSNKIYCEYMRYIIQRADKKFKELFHNHNIFSWKFPNTVEINDVWYEGIEESAVELAKTLHLNNSGSKIDKFNGSCFLEKFHYSPTISC